MSQLTAYSKINDSEGLELIGNAICRSGMFGCESKEAGIVFALQCMVENKPPLEMAKNYHLVKGKLTKRADAMLADFRRAGGKVFWSDLKNAEIQSAVFEFENQNTNASFSMEDARKAGLVRKGSAWDKTPAAMLRARCVSETLRAIAPEIVQGVYVPEEIDVADSTTIEIPKTTINEVIEVAENKNPKNERPYLESLIRDADIEQKSNDYWTVKGKIDIDLDQTWRDLPDDLQQRMEMDFPSFQKAIGNTSWKDEHE